MVVIKYFSYFSFSLLFQSMYTDYASKNTDLPMLLAWAFFF